MLTPIDWGKLEGEIVIIWVALEAQFNLDPFSPCTRTLRLMEVLSESQLNNASQFVRASGNPITNFVHSLCSVNPKDPPLFHAFVGALTAARNLDPAAWAKGLDNTLKLHQFLLHTQLKGNPYLILGYVIGVGTYSPALGGPYHSSDQYQATSSADAHADCQSQDAGGERSRRPPLSPLRHRQRHQRRAGGVHLHEGKQLGCHQFGKRISTVGPLELGATQEASIGFRQSRMG